MKTTPRLVLLFTATLGLAVSVAKADTFNYSYLFGDGLSVTGSLEGTQNGNFVENVSNVSLFFNGSAIPGSSIVTASYDGSAFVDGPAVVSFDAWSNNFLFHSNDFDIGFYMVNETVFGSNSVTAYAFTEDLFLASTEETSQDGTWSLKASPVPESASTFALLGLTVTGLLWLRRRQPHVTAY